MHHEPTHPTRTRHDIVVRAMGRRVGVNVSGSAARSFAASFEHAWKNLIDDTGDEVDCEVTVHADDDSSLGLRRALSAISSSITIALIESNLGRGHLFHSAALLDAHDNAALLIGPSGAGKTTAAIRLGRTTRYLTDETAFVDWDAHVVPYPKPLSVIVDGAAVKAQVAPEELGLETPQTGRFPVTRLIVLNRQPCGSGGDPRCERLDLLAGLFALLPQVSRLSASPRPITALAGLIASIGGVERLSYVDIDDVGSGGLPDAPTLDPGSFAFSALDLSGICDISADAKLEEGPRFARARVDDAIATGDHLVLAQASTVTALQGISATIWFETASARSRDELLETLRRIHGPSPDDAAIADSALGELVAAGILRRHP